MGKLESTQAENIHNAALLISESIRNGGILQAFGSGHSYAGAIEVCGRAGGLIPSKVVRDYSEGIFRECRGKCVFSDASGRRTAGRRIYHHFKLGKKSVEH